MIKHFILSLGLILIFASISQAKDFYEQTPMTEQEVLKFIDDLPLYRKWARAEKELAHPSISKNGRPDFTYSQKAATKVKELGWKPERFFFVMGKAAAGLALQEKGTPMRDKSVDMPVLKTSEFNLIRRHQNSLIKAGNLN